MPDCIEILSPALLDQHRPVVTGLRALARQLDLEFGWHYLLDLAWILDRLGPPQGRQVLDAGAGVGMIQWWLAAQGASVLSVDRSSRAALPLRFRRRFNARGLRPADLDAYPKAVQKQIAAGLLPVLRSEARNLPGFLFGGPPAPGTVTIYNQDLAALDDIPANSQDAVVAVSALEHNTPENLAGVVNELLRVLKPGGMLLATLGAAPEQDWFHQPSSGWCYTEASLRRLFQLDDAAPSNYEQYPAIFAALHACTELRDNLAGFYFRSGDNGMPWGRWDPQYPVVGVCKIKQEF
jgi:SAM-dependent methyltransferase